MHYEQPMMLSVAAHHSNIVARDRSAANRMTENSVGCPFIQARRCLQWDAAAARSASATAHRLICGGMVCGMCYCL